MSCVASRSGVDCIDPMKGLSAGSSSSELSLGAEESSLSLATMDGCLNNARRASPSMVKWGLAGYAAQRARTPLLLDVASFTCEDGPTALRLVRPHLHVGFAMLHVQGGILLQR
jgi:hypothetical protein